MGGKRLISALIKISHPRPDNANEFWSHSETRFWNVTPGCLRSSAFFLYIHVDAERAVIFSLQGKQKSLSHFIGHHWDQYEEYEPEVSVERRKGKEEEWRCVEGDTDGQEPLWWRLLLARCHQPQTPFVCQATKLIEIKAGSRWPGIIKSLTNTNKAENEGPKRAGFPRPAESERFGESGRGWLSLRV